MANEKGREKTRDAKTRDAEIRVPVVEEQIAIGKRAVERGGVRVTSTVEKVAVEEKVRLREEHLDVQRRPVDRAATAADMDAFKDGTLEVRTSGEEAVVEKRSRVVEEIVVGKHATERDETIKDTVRHTEVTIEPVVPEGDAPQGFDGLDTRSHFQTNYAEGGYSYGDYSNAYRYGWALASDADLRRKGWSTVEPAARRTWEEKNRGTWDQFNGAVRHAFEARK